MSRKRRGDENQGGGSWKIAIADFFTAMMAFFLVMWLSGQSEEIRSSTAGYFRDPFGQSGQLAGGSGPMAGQSPIDQRISPLVTGNARQRAIFEEAQEALESAIAEHPNFTNLEEYIDIRITEEGLVIELLDSEESFFFELGRDELKKDARELIAVIAETLSTLPNPVAIEGHTDATPFRSVHAYSNWELSVARANSARRVMESILRDRQIAEVRGYADRKLKDPTRPRHFSNRRVSIVALYIDEEDVPTQNANVKGVAEGSPVEVIRSTY